MDGKAVLTLLGLALRGGNLALGEEMVADALRDHRARTVFLASDASEKTRSRAERSARLAGCPCVVLPSPKEDLGRAVGRAQLALAAVTDTGLAAAVLRRLAEGDPARYGPAAEQMARKARRPERPHGPTGSSPKEPRAQRPPDRPPARPSERQAAPGRPAGHTPRPGGGKRSHPDKPRAHPYAHSRPVKKGKGSFRDKEKK